MAASSIPRLRGVTVAPDGTSFVLIVGRSGIVKKTNSLFFYEIKRKRKDIRYRGKAYVYYKFKFRHKSCDGLTS